MSNYKAYHKYIVELVRSAMQKANNAAETLNHRALEGEVREIALKLCIEPFLTVNFGVGAGKVIDSYGNTSSQIDVIVYDKRSLSPIFYKNEMGLFPVEGVRYIFEVKSKLTAKEIRDANKKFLSVSQLISYPEEDDSGKIIRRGNTPAAVLFAFDSNAKGNEADRYVKISRENGSSCSCICVLGKGYWIFDYENKEWVGEEKTPDIPDFDEFCTFITGFVNTLYDEGLNFRRFYPGKYISSEIGRKNVERLKAKG